MEGEKRWAVDREALSGWSRSESESRGQLTEESKRRVVSVVELRELLA